MKLERLVADFERMKKLSEKSRLIDIEYSGNPPDKYTVTYKCKGLCWLNNNNAPSITINHKMEIYLHNDYPRKPPQLKWLTNIFHPNILSYEHNGGVCIGDWYASETLDRLCIRIGEMVQYKSFSIEDALDKEAAKWTITNKDKLPIDKTILYEEI